MDKVRIVLIASWATFSVAVSVEVISWQFSVRWKVR